MTQNVLAVTMSGGQDRSNETSANRMTIRPRQIAFLYGLYTLLAVLLIAPTMPPFQNPDEGSHALRADQISHFHLVAARLPGGGSGGVADSGVGDENGMFTSLPFHRERKVTRAMFAPAGWGTPLLIGFSNTAIYPPFFYLPAAVTMFCGRNLNLTVLHTMLLARIATGVATALLGTIAIALADNAAIWFFAILMLPMSLSLGAGITQDGPLIASTALAVALCLRLRRSELANRRLLYALLCISLALIGMARPPYLAFALIVFSTRVPRMWQIFGVALIVLCVVGWSAYDRPYIVLPQWPTGVVDPGAQFSALIHHPGRWLWLIASSCWNIGHTWLLGFVGCLGWLDVDLPLDYHYFARASLVLALITAWLSGAGPARWFDVAITVTAILSACCGVLLIQYLTWSVVGAPLIDGVQGRYALAPALLLGAAIGRPFVAKTYMQSALTALLLATPIISIAVTVHALVLRYYF